MTSLLIALVLSAAIEPAAPQRVAIVVGANDAAPGRRPLRYAHKDARAVSQLLADVGGFLPTDVHVLYDPDPRAVLEALDSQLTALADDADSMLLFYYSGHADAEALYPKGEALALSELRARLESDSARVRVGIIDACRGGGWTGAKGMRETEPFNIPLTLASEGSVLIASSSGLEDAHESEHLQGSFFTHHWLAGLRGAADDDGDSQVTLNEAFTYARQLTIRDTAMGTPTPQHPSYHVNLRGRRDLPLTQLARAATFVALEQEDGPLELVHLDTGLIVLEAPPGKRRVRLAVTPGAYAVRKRTKHGLYVTEIRVAAGSTTEIDEGSLVLVGEDRLATKSHELRPAARTTLPRGYADISVAVGVRHSATTPNAREVRSDIVLDERRSVAGSVEATYGLTDRLQWSVPTLGFAYRFGDIGGLELVPWGGLLSWGAGFSSVESLIVTGTLGLGFDAKWWLTRNLGLTFGAGARSSYQKSWGDFGRQIGPQQPALASSAGVAYHLGDVATLNLGVAGAYVPYLRFDADGEDYVTDSHTILSFGAVQSLGLRQLPLVSLHVGESVSLDLHAGVNVDLDTRLVTESYLGGISWVW